MPGFIKKQCLDRFRTPAKGRGQSMRGAGAIPASKPAGHPFGPPQRCTEQAIRASTAVHGAGHPGLPQLCTEQAIWACHSCARSRPAWPEVAFQRPLLLLSCLVMSSSLQPHGYSPPVPSVCGGQEYWSGSPFPSLGDLPDPGIKEAVSPVSSSLQTDSLPAEPPLANSKQLFLEARRSRLWAEWAPGQGIVSGS